MIIETERLILRKWTVRDADNLFKYAKNPNVGPMAGWPIHKNVDESKFVIENVLNGAECYVICLKDSGAAIGSIELKLNGYSNLTKNDDECELGFWLAEEYWGNGFVPEASKALISRAFNDLNMNIIWCGYYDGNNKSKRVQEKLGFVYHHTIDNVYLSLLDETRICYVNCLKNS